MCEHRNFSSNDELKFALLADTGNITNRCTQAAIGRVFEMVSRLSPLGDLGRYLAMCETISNATNTLVPAYLALKAMGYSVSCQKGKHDEQAEVWSAEGGHGSFVAEDPVCLLGLVAMRQERGPDWKASDEQISAFLSEYAT